MTRQGVAARQRDRLLALGHGHGLWPAHGERSESRRVRHDASEAGGGRGGEERSGARVCLTRAPPRAPSSPMPNLHLRHPPNPWSNSHGAAPPRLLRRPVPRADPRARPAAAAPAARPLHPGGTPAPRPPVAPRAQGGRHTSRCPLATPSRERGGGGAALLPPPSPSPSPWFCTRDPPPLHHSSRATASPLPSHRPAHAIRAPARAPVPQ